MGKTRDYFNAFTGVSGRHNKALRDISDWLEPVQSFLNSYGIYGSDDLKRLLEYAGDAKFDLTGIAYNGRPLVKQAQDIKGADVPPLVQAIIENLEGMRRYLMNPAMQEHRLKESAQNLVASYEKLQETLAQTKGM